MYRNLRVAVVLLSTIWPLSNACVHGDSQTFSAKKSRNLAGDEPKTSGRWTDFGTVIADEALKLSITQNQVYALSGQTLFARKLNGMDAWRELDTFDDEIAGIFTVSGATDTIILTVADAFETLPLRISHDGGKSFQEYGAEFTESRDKIGAEYETPKQFFREESGKLYASLAGLKTAVSQDLGKTWAYAISGTVGESCSGGESRTITLPSYPGVIFKSQDCPLKDATVASISDLPTEKKLEKLIDETFLGQKSANILAASAASPDTLYVGVENGVFRYNVKDKKSEWLIEAPSEQEWSGYFSQIWVNPTNANHIVLSGQPRDSRLEFLLFESLDGGKSFASLRSPKDPAGKTESAGGAIFGKTLAISAKEDPTTARIWLFDLSRVGQ